MAAASSSAGGTQALDRAALLLACFLGSDAELSLTELARRTGLKVPTAHRLLGALCRAGLLARDDLTDGYRLGVTTIALGQIALTRADLAGAPDEVRALSERTGETATLGILHGSDVVIIVQVLGRHPLRVDRPPGTHVAAHASAMGKVLLAHAPAAANRLAEPVSLTDRTIVDPEALSIELDRVRREGVGVSDGEQYEGVFAVAAPVIDRSGQVVAAVAVQAPSTRCTATRREELRAAVQDTARHIGAPGRR